MENKFNSFPVSEESSTEEATVNEWSILGGEYQEPRSGAVSRLVASETSFSKGVVSLAMHAIELSGLTAPAEELADRHAKLESTVPINPDTYEEFKDELELHRQVLDNLQKAVDLSYEYGIAEREQLRTITKRMTPKNTPVLKIIRRMAGEKGKSGEDKIQPMVSISHTDQCEMVFRILAAEEAGLEVPLPSRLKPVP